MQIPPPRAEDEEAAQDAPREEDAQDAQQPAGSEEGRRRQLDRQNSGGGLNQVHMRVIGARSSSRNLTREDLERQGVPQHAVDGRIAQQNIEETFMLQFAAFFFFFGVFFMLLLLTQLALFMWFIVTFLIEGQKCEGPLKFWATMTFCIILFNLTLNRKTARGSFVQRLVCCFTQEPTDPRPVPMRVWAWEILGRCVLPMVWNCLGIHWVLEDSDSELSCGASTPRFFVAARVYSVFNVSFTFVALLGVLGVATVFRHAMRHGLLTSNSGASPKVIESLKVVDLKDINLQENPSCSICLEDYSEAKTIITTGAGCGHNFHQECLKNWLQVDHTCPLCRTDLEAALSGEAPASAV